VPNRWIVYQRERFPLLAHGPLIAAFSGSAVSYSALLRGGPEPPGWGALLVAFPAALLFFLQLRIADEFKDQEEDRRYRPSRPVPRGLIGLQELAVIALSGALVQLALSTWRDFALTALLALVWLYLALMSCEFFARDWLRARPLTYLWTHMLIMPLIDLYVTAVDWLPLRGWPPRGLAWFLAVSFFCGTVIEIGRKIRAPDDEAPGVPTYSALWGRRTAVGAWLGAILLGGLTALAAARRIGPVWPVACLLALPLTAASAGAVRFLRRPDSARSRIFEPLSGLWVLLTYLGLGALPHLVRLAQIIHKGLVNNLGLLNQ
jgi:4-hydroxybenzoate polyprenyltransferase